jgi:hypothetical protein
MYGHAVTQVVLPGVQGVSAALVHKLYPLYKLLHMCHESVQVSLRGGRGCRSMVLQCQFYPGSSQTCRH